MLLIKMILVIVLTALFFGKVIKEMIETSLSISYCLWLVSMLTLLHLYNLFVIASTLETFLGGAFYLLVALWFNYIVSDVNIFSKFKPNVSNNRHFVAAILLC